MKKLWLILLLAGMGYTGRAQQNLFRVLLPDDVGALSDKEERILNQYRSGRMVASVSFIRVNDEALKNQEIDIEIGAAKTRASRKLLETGADDESLSWFGRLSDETGIFFTSMNHQIASKFYLGNTPYLIIPFRNDIHLLIAFTRQIDEGICGTPHGGKAAWRMDADKGRTGALMAAEETQAFSPDDNCTMRVLWMVTAQAEPEITMNLELAARMLQDETNLAYQQSIINYRMEIARVERTSYVETTANTTATAYSVTSSYPTDLINMSTGAGLLSTVPTLRNLYNADVVVMVRSQATNSAQGFYGVAYGVPTDPATLNANNAFAIISTEYMIGGRFTFAHEIGHIQGARHDNHTAAPTYARGYVFSSSATDNRTIMAVGGSCNPPTGCRVQFFSNPAVTYLSIPVGIANQRDNARRINETATQILAHRLTSTSLLLPAETFGNEILARHLATQTISTNNNLVIAQSGSRVSMRAGNSVTLLPGFLASSGSVFTGYIQTCSYVPTTDRQAADPAVKARERISSAEGNAAFTLIPNPAGNQVKLVLGRQAATGSRMVLMDLHGLILQQKNILPETQQLDIDLSTCPAGVYLVKIINIKGETSSRKLVKN